MNTENKVVQHAEGEFEVLGGTRIDKSAVDIFCNLRPIAEISGKTWEEAKANAEHIVRCWNNFYPLLNALRELVSVIPDSNDIWEDASQVRQIEDATKQALAAIKAAEEGLAHIK